jgi:DtxR family transcriptional regulator, Mn-dependent transcriptional regulator
VFVRGSITIEDYLETLYILQRDGIPIVGARLAEILGVTPPTVTNTLKRMQRDGLIEPTETQGFHLTLQGLDQARSVMRRHMLTEWLLMSVLKVPWSQTHTEAHHLEHMISDLIEERMRDNLGDPKTCPHGNPMPGFEAVAAAWIPLIEIGQGEKVIIRRIHEMGENDPDLLKFLEENGLIPGAEVEIVEILQFNQTINLISGDRTVALGFSSARSIYVERAAG